MPLDPAFVDDCPYGPEALLLDEILQVDVEKSLVVARMPVHEDLPLTCAQRVHPVKHPRHVNGGLMVHMTGMLGFVHAYYVFGLRHADAWIGYGAKIHSARFASLATVAEPLILRGWCTRARRSPTNIVARYSFEFRQKDALVYESEQTAMWLKAGEAAAPTLGSAA